MAPDPGSGSGSAVPHTIRDDVNGDKFINSGSRQLASFLIKTTNKWPQNEASDNNNAYGNRLASETEAEAEALLKLGNELMLEVWKYPRYLWSGNCLARC